MATQFRDANDWPIVPSARVRIEYPIKWSDDRGLDHRVTRHGEVLSAEPDLKGRPVVKVREYETRHLLAVRPEWCRVMRGETAVSKRERIVHGRAGR